MKIVKLYEITHINTRRGIIKVSGGGYLREGDIIKCELSTNFGSKNLFTFRVNDDWEFDSRVNTTFLDSTCELRDIQHDEYLKLSEKLNRIETAWKTLGKDGRYGKHVTKRN